MHCGSVATIVVVEVVTAAAETEVTAGMEAVVTAVEVEVSSSSSNSLDKTSSFSGKVSRFRFPDHLQDRCFRLGRLVIVIFVVNFEVFWSWSKTVSSCFAAIRARQERRS
ncbi:hypothetical protein OIU85_003969 [Salix viminalis]|uniref:Secreted protein n=1 Tax=Salix viminalis TaxID=40686 RepID=A0A9Q0PRL0_SALVM|nr:hypothetical protein OIU85_003969 [Salix viminalis]